MKYIKETISSIVVSILLTSILLVGIVSATASNNATDIESEQDALAAFLLKVGEKDKEILFEYIENSDLNQDEKNDLIDGLLDAWDRYPDNNKQDYLVAQKALDIMVSVANIEKEKEANNYPLLSDSELQIKNRYSVKSDLNLVEIKGDTAAFSSNEEKYKWYSNLDNIRNEITDEIKPYLYPNGPVIGYGWNAEGYFTIDLYNKMDVPSLQREELYILINNKATKFSEKEVSVAFINSDFVQECYLGYDNYRRPLIGGIQLCALKDGNYQYASMGYACKEDDETKGYVTAKHFASYAGLDIYQPTFMLAYGVGEADLIGGVYADATFVEYSNVDSKIYLGNSQTCDVEDYIASEPSSSWVGKTAYSSGKTSGLRYGNIDSINNLVNQSGHLYYEQIFAEYVSSPGDSGGPVYVLVGTNPRIIGLTHGTVRSGTMSVFSSVYHVYNDLCVLPIEVNDYPKGDFNNDGLYNLPDLSAFALSYNTIAFDLSFDSTADFNEDGEVDLADLSAFALLYDP